ncbi:MAG: hypothetical protein KFF68_02755 [Desulfosarcina sp.]|nr:hypothetical protein [Desulfosarcina sp.]
MKNVITLIVILIAVWSMVNKYKAKRKKGSGAKPAPGSWVTKLKGFLADIQRQIEQQSKDRSGNASGWDRFLDDGETHRSSSDGDDLVLDDRVLTEAQTQPPAKKIPPVAPVRGQTFRSDKTQVDPGALRRRALTDGKPSRTFMAASRADLRNAVVWSEILGPPMALRDQRRGQR